VGRFFHVKLPLLKPTVALVALVSSIAALKVFDEVYILIAGMPAGHKTIVPYLYATAFEHFEMGYASAVSVVTFFILLFFSYLHVKVWRE